MPGWGREPPQKQFYKVKYTCLFEATHVYVTKQCGAVSREACFFEPGAAGRCGDICAQADLPAGRAAPGSGPLVMASP